jgi:hypothetical protein
VNTALARAAFVANERDPQHPSAYIDNATTVTRKRSESRAMNTTPIPTEADYKAALKTIESLMSAQANTPDGDRLDALVTLVEAYERAQFPAASSRIPTARV